MGLKTICKDRCPHHPLLYQHHRFKNRFINCILYYARSCGYFLDPQPRAVRQVVTISPEAFAIVELLPTRLLSIPTTPYNNLN